MASPPSSPVEEGRIVMSSENAEGGEKPKAATLIRRLTTITRPQKKVLFTDIAMIVSRFRHLRKLRRDRVQPGPPDHHDYGHRHFSPTTCKMQPQLYRAIAEGDDDWFNWQISKLPNLALVKTAQGNTVAHVAAGLAKDKLVELSLSCCPELAMIRNDAGDLAFHVAAAAGHLSTVRSILAVRARFAAGPYHTPPSNAGVDVLINQQNAQSNTALHLALKNGHHRLARLLVEKSNCEPPCLSSDGDDVRMAAEAEGPDPEVGPDVEALQLQAKPLVHAAIQAKNRDILEAVTKDQSTLFTYDEKGRTPLSVAASMGYLGGVRDILNTSVDAIHRSDWDGFFPIHWASMGGHVDILDMFLQRCPDSSEMLNEEGQNILHVAAECGKVKVISHMLKTDPNVGLLINQKDVKGDTPLHLATKGGQAGVVNILTWDKRVDLELTNNDGLTALDIAEAHPQSHLSFYKSTKLCLRYANAAGGPGQKPKGEHLHRRPRPGNSASCKVFGGNKYMRIETLLTVATLVTSMTFGAFLAVPGGFKDYSYPDHDQGMATLAKKHVLQVFLITTILAMSTSTAAAILLVGAMAPTPIRSSHVFLKLAFPLLGVALSMLSLAFLLAVHLAVSNLTWLATLVTLVASFSILPLSLLFAPHFFPCTSQYRIIRFILRYLLHLLILATDLILKNNSLYSSLLIVPLRQF